VHAEVSQTAIMGRVAGAGNAGPHSEGNVPRRNTRDGHSGLQIVTRCELGRCAGCARACRGVSRGRGRRRSLTRSPKVIRSHALWPQTCMAAYHKRRSCPNGTTTILQIWRHLTTFADLARTATLRSWNLATLDHKRRSWNPAVTAGSRHREHRARSIGKPARCRARAGSMLTQRPRLIMDSELGVCLGARRGDITVSGCGWQWRTGLRCRSLGFCSLNRFK